MSRAKALLGAMSLGQKVSQMVQAERLHVEPAEAARHQLGSVLSGGGSCPGENRPDDWIAMADAYWEAYGREARTNSNGAGPPPVYGVDAVHGHNNVAGATVFPHNIGMGALVAGAVARDAGDPTEFVERAARATALEVLATGVDWTFAPCVAVAGDPRWGRTYESYGSDPELVAACGAAAVRGFQDGASLPESSGKAATDGLAVGPEGVLACAKHWVGDGGTTRGVDQGDTSLSEDELRSVHVLPYLDVLASGAATVMVSLSSWNGELCHGHRGLVTGLLKHELGFDGVVVSDWNGIDRLAEDYRSAVVKAVNAGIDLFMVPENWLRFSTELESAVRSGEVGMARIDDAVRRILTVKERSGLLDAPRPSERPGVVCASFGTRVHRDLARECVRRSLVLLKHRGTVLPLRADQRILVTGRRADDVGAQCGGFTLEWQGVRDNGRFPGGQSIWGAVRERAPDAEYLPDLDDPAQADGFDVAIVVIGERPYAEGMGDIRQPNPAPLAEKATPGAGPGALEPYGETLVLEHLHPRQLRLIESLAHSGIPVVTVLFSGRPLAVDRELALSDAFVAAWLPGTEGGGVVDGLFGKSDFRGRLPMDWPATPESAHTQLVRMARGYGLGLCRG